jgi:hypothetical protein
MKKLMLTVLLLSTGIVNAGIGVAPGVSCKTKAGTHVSIKDFSSKTGYALEEMLSEDEIIFAKATNSLSIADMGNFSYLEFKIEKCSDLKDLSITFGARDSHLITSKKLRRFNRGKIKEISFNEQGDLEVLSTLISSGINIKTVLYFSKFNALEDSEVRGLIIVDDGFFRLPVTFGELDLEFLRGVIKHQD